MAETKTKRKPAPARDVLADQKDGEGNLINPPTLPEFEQRLAVAHLAADQAEVEAVQEEYHKARVERAKVLAARKQAA